VERRTRQKQAIEAVLEKHKNPLTAPEIQRLALREVPTLGLATVYRFLKALARDGRVVSVEIPGQMPRYERADKGHHHHFLCRVCGAVFELERCLAGIKTMAPPRFRVEDHEIILYGSCETCLLKQRSNLRKAKSTPRRLAA
jgi:Fur family transcriptional regulator, ferric uptake regulator